MKRIYFLFGTALLLCCLVNFNVALAQDGTAVATWPLTDEAALTATSTGNISAADMAVSNMAAHSTRGLEGSQRVQIMRGEDNLWPADNSEMIEDVYIEFIVSPHAGSAFTATSFSYDISSSGTNNMSARAFYSTDPSFENATEIVNGSGGENNNVPRDTDTDDNGAPLGLVNVTATVNQEVGTGETLYLRIYPWMHNASETTGRANKYIHLKNVVITGTTSDDDGETSCTPSEMTPYYTLDGGTTWPEETTITAEVGQTLKFGPHPHDEEGDWEWEGPNGYEASTRDPEIEITSANQSGVYSASFTNAEGCTGILNFTITVNATDPGTDPGTGTEEKTIVFVTDDDKDNEQIEWLRSEGYNVTTLFEETGITEQSDIDRLNNADLVIIGRSGNSGQLANSKAVFNAVTAPMILNAQYAAFNDNARLDWFEGSAAHLNDTDGTIGVMTATILAPDDEVFSGVTPGEGNTLPWSNTPDDYLNATSPGNATVLATANNSDPAGAILFARFAANQPFYTGGETPAGERVYFGFGNDNTKNEAGEDIINYFPLTDEAKTIYLAEIMRLAGEPGDGGTDPDPTVSAPSNPTPADEMENVATADLTLEWEGDAETYNVYWGTSEDNLALAENGEALTTTSFSPANVMGGTEYFWRVDAMAEGAETVEGPVWSFTTAGTPSGDATLTDLTINGTTITGFDAATQTYTMQLPAGTTTVTVDGTAAAGATISEDGTGAIALTEGDNEHVIVVTAADGTEMRYTINFVVAPTGIAGLAAEGVSIYPNPVNGFSTVSLSNAAEIATVNVYTNQGVLVKTISAGNSGNISIPVTELPEGLYLLKAVKKDRSVLTGKFVK